MCTTLVSWIIPNLVWSPDLSFRQTSETRSFVSGLLLFEFTVEKMVEKLVRL